MSLVAEDTEFLTSSFTITMQKDETMETLGQAYSMVDALKTGAASMVVGVYYKGVQEHLAAKSMSDTIALMEVEVARLIGKIFRF